MATLPLPANRREKGERTEAKPASMVGTAILPPARLSALEWSVVAMAEQDGLSSIREPSRYTRALRRFFGWRPPNRLANDRLEALRRLAIFAWHHGWNVPKSELSAFLAAGFTLDHFELVQNSLSNTRAARGRKRAR